MRDPHRLVGEAGDDFELAAHRLDVAAQGAQIHVGAAFELRDRRLLDVQLLRHLDLGTLAGFANLAKRRLLGDQFRRPLSDGRSVLFGELRHEII